MIKSPPGSDPAPTVLVSAGALIDAGGRVLVQRRPAGKPMAGLWEFPGGKVEPGERPEQALARELAEELAIVVDPACATPVGFASSGDLVLLLYAIDTSQGSTRPLSASALTWVLPDVLIDLPMPPLDRPLIAPLAAFVRGRMGA